MVHANRAEALPLLRSYIRWMFGIEATKISGWFALAARAARPASTLALKVAVGVMPATVLVQASFAPISIVTYCAPCDTAFCACEPRAADAAPLTASL